MLRRFQRRGSPRLDQAGTERTLGCRSRQRHSVRRRQAQGPRGACHHWSGQPRRPSCRRSQRLPRAHRAVSPRRTRTRLRLLLSVRPSLCDMEKQCPPKEPSSSSRRPKRRPRATYACLRTTLLFCSMDPTPKSSGCHLRIRERSTSTRTCRARRVRPARPVTWLPTM